MNQNIFKEARSESATAAHIVLANYFYCFSKWPMRRLLFPSISPFFFITFYYFNGNLRACYTHGRMRWIIIHRQESLHRSASKYLRSEKRRIKQYKQMCVVCVRWVFAVFSSILMLKRVKVTILRVKYTYLCTRVVFVYGWTVVVIVRALHAYGQMFCERREFSSVI